MTPKCKRQNRIALFEFPPSLGRAVLVVGDEGVEPPAELVLLLYYVVGDGPPPVVRGGEPAQGDGAVVEVHDVGVPRGRRGLWGKRERAIRKWLVVLWQLREAKKHQDENPAQQQQEQKKGAGSGTATAGGVGITAAGARSVVTTAGYQIIALLLLLQQQQQHVHREQLQQHDDKTMSSCRCYSSRFVVVVAKGEKTFKKLNSICYVIVAHCKDSPP